jgi:hypothetical protein
MQPCWDLEILLSMENGIRIFRINPMDELGLSRMAQDTEPHDP